MNTPGPGSYNVIKGVKPLVKPTKNPKPEPEPDLIHIPVEEPKKHIPKSPSLKNKKKEL